MLLKHLLMYFLPFRFIMLRKSVTHILQGNTVNSLLGALGACLKGEAFGWAFVRTGYLIEPVRLSKKLKK